MKPKTATEKRAAEFCSRIKTWCMPLAICLVWKRHRVWGNCPYIYDPNDGLLASAMGTGYDKKSSCMSQLLRWLAETPEQYAAIRDLDSVGMNTLIPEFNKLGLGELKDMTSTNGVSVFIYTPLSVMPPVGKLDISDIDCVIAAGETAYVDVTLHDGKPASLAIHSDRQRQYIDLYAYDETTLDAEGKPCEVNVGTLHYGHYFYK